MVNVKYNKNWEVKYDWHYYDDNQGGAFYKYYTNILKNKSSGKFFTIPFTDYRKSMVKVYVLNALLFAWIFMIPLELFVSESYNTA